MRSFTIFAVIAGLVRADVDQCTPSFDTPVKASFNLKPLMQGIDKALMANDTYYSSEINPRPFRYFFNVCDKLNDPHDESTTIRVVMISFLTITTLR